MEITSKVIERSFVEESTEGLAVIEALLVGLEQNSDPESVNTIFRTCHTIKGNALALDFKAVAEMTHAMEDLLERVRMSSSVLSSSTADLLLHSVDAVRTLLGARKADRAELPEKSRQLLNALRTKCSELDINNVSSGATVRNISALEGSSAEIKSETSTRVQIEKLDRLINLWGEVAISRGRLSNALLKPDDASIHEIADIHHGMEQLFIEIQELVFKLRMVPLGPTFRQLNRLVRDLAKSANKAARLELSGTEVELDSRMIEQIRDPLAHMIRNAVDHGIEKQEQRVTAGKPSCGVIRVTACRRPGSIVIDVSDDGAGLDRERILQRARQQGLLSDSSHMSDDEVFALIFRPGFSTAEKVTDISGRGVGMDVVQRNIQSLRGSVSVLRTGPSGTTLRIQLPLTLAIIDGFMVRVSDSMYIIPMDSVVECVEMPAGESRAAQVGVLDLRGEPVPYIRLSRLFPSGASVHRENVVIVTQDAKKTGIAVEELIGARQVVVKPLREVLGSLNGLAGSTILGDGSVALILDIPGIVQSASRSARAVECLTA